MMDAVARSGSRGRYDDEARSSFIFASAELRLVFMGNASSI